MYLKDVIKNIDKKINKELIKLNLTPEEPLNRKFISRANHYYITPCFDENQKRYIFKSSLLDEKKFLDRLTREIYFHQQILNHFPGKINFIPQYIISGNEGKFIWMLREYANGQPLGFLREVNSNLLEKKHLSFILQEIFFIRKILQKIFTNKKCPLKIPRSTYAYKFYLKEKDQIDYNPNSFKKIEKYQTKQLDFKKILNFYREHKKLLSGSLTTLVHGDFNPQNLLINTDKINIIDWERIHYDNLPGEIDFLWASAWNKPNWRKELLKQYFINVKNKKEFSILWRLAILARSWGEAWCWYHQMKKSTDKKSIYKCQRAIIINLDYLYRASRSFDDFF